MNSFSSKNHQSSSGLLQQHLHQRRRSSSEKANHTTTQDDTRFFVSSNLTSSSRITTTTAKTTTGQQQQQQQQRQQQQQQRPAVEATAKTKRILILSMQVIFSSFLLWVVSMFLATTTTRAFSRFGVTAAGGTRRPSSLWIPFSRTVSVSSASVAKEQESATTSSTATSSKSSNPFLQQDDLPKFASLEPQYLTPAMDTLLAQFQTDFSALESKLSQEKKGSGNGNGDNNGNDNEVLSYDDVLPVVERMQFPLGYAWGVAGHLNGVKNGPELRQAYETNQPKLIQALSAVSQSQPLYEALKVVQQEQQQDDDNDNNFLRRQQRRAVEQSLRSMTLGGVGLQGADKERFNEIRMKLASLATSFSNNLLDATKAFSLTIDSDNIQKMDGIPESAKALWANAHIAHLKQQQQQQQQENSGDNDTDQEIPELDAERGPWRITLDMPSYIAVMSHMKDRSIRETVYRAYITRASDLQQGNNDNNDNNNNIPAIYEILQLKQEMAQLLGFDNYAELSLASKMAPSVDAVAELTDLIAAQALPAAQAELQELTELARNEGGIDKDETTLAPWDLTYWRERLKEQKFNLTEEETRPYFALPAVLDGLFALVERLFNVQVTAADGEAQVWHDDVRFFKVTDVATGKHIASFYLDPYSRPADKNGGAWMDVCIGKSAAVGRDVAVAYLTCNGSPPVGTKPSLMTFSEVETLFHEFGHGLQHMLTQATVGDVAGINGIEWDAVELPSQFMENWCYDDNTVLGSSDGNNTGFAKHWETGEPMPKEMFDKLKQQKNFGSGMMTCRQLYFGQMDLELHSNYDARKKDDGDGESIFDVQRRVAAKYTPYSLPLPEDRFLCSFAHIFAGGYSAGYYSYIWAEVMSADAFSAFEEAIARRDETEVKHVGQRFRDTVLSWGGGVPPMQVFTEFRGREPTPEALLRHKGLVTTTS